MRKVNRRICILDTNIDALSMRETVDLVDKYVKNKEPLHLMGVNADKINMMGKNPRLKEIVNNCGIINADGASVVLASKFLKKELPERVAGIDLMEELIKLSSQKGYKVYFLGAKQKIVEETAKVLSERYPNLNVVGIKNGYFKEDDWPAVCEELKISNPDFVFVGITSPLKEYIVDYMQRQGVSGVFMGVGGSFDVLSGHIPRAPKWMQNSNLEWLFRVIQEPRRLFKRYFIGNSQFIKNVIKERVMS